MEGINFGNRTLLNTTRNATDNLDVKGRIICLNTTLIRAPNDRTGLVLTRWAGIVIASCIIACFCFILYCYCSMKIKKRKLQQAIQRAQLRRSGPWPIGNHSLEPSTYLNMTDNWNNLGNHDGRPLNWIRHNPGRAAEQVLNNI